MISVQCACGKAFMTKPANAGKKTKCPTCGNMLTIPGGASAGVSAGADEIDELLGSWPPVQAPPSESLPPPPRPSAISPDRAAPGGGVVVSAPAAASHSHRGRRSDPGVLDFDSSVFVGLIDVSFRRFITPAIIRSLYLSHLFLVVLSVGMLLYFNYRALVASASDEFTSPIISYLVIIAMNLLAFLLLFIWTLIVRLALEAVMVLFRGEEHLRALVELNSET